MLLTFTMPHSDVLQFSGWFNFCLLVSGDRWACMSTMSITCLACFHYPWINWLFCVLSTSVCVFVCHVYAAGYRRCMVAQFWLLGLGVNYFCLFIHLFFNSLQIHLGIAVIFGLGVFQVGKLFDPVYCHSTIVLMIMSQKSLFWERRIMYCTWKMSSFWLTDVKMCL